MCTTLSKMGHLVRRSTLAVGANSVPGFVSVEKPAYNPSPLTFSTAWGKPSLQYQFSAQTQSQIWTLASACQLKVFEVQKLKQFNPVREFSWGSTGASGRMLGCTIYNEPIHMARVRGQAMSLACSTFQIRVSTELNSKDP